MGRDGAGTIQEDSGVPCHWERMCTLDAKVDYHRTKVCMDPKAMAKLLSSSTVHSKAGFWILMQGYFGNSKSKPEVAMPRINKAA